MSSEPYLQRNHYAKGTRDYTLYDTNPIKVRSEDDIELTVAKTPHQVKIRVLEGTGNESIILDSTGGIKIDGVVGVKLESNGFQYIETNAENGEIHLNATGTSSGIELDCGTDGINATTTGPIVLDCGTITTLDTPQLKVPVTQVSQETNIGTGVTCNAMAGIIITQSATLAAGTSTTFAVSNSLYEPGDLIFMNWAYDAALTGTGLPLVQLHFPSQTAGTFSIAVRNLDSSNALDGPFTIFFWLVKAL